MPQQLGCQNLIDCFYECFYLRRALFDQVAGQPCTVDCADWLIKDCEQDVYFGMALKEAGMKVLLQPRFEVVV